MGAGIGAGVGFGMAQHMGPWGAIPGGVIPGGAVPGGAAPDQGAPQQAAQPQTVPPPPPPPPAETLWHTAVDGATQGPFSRSHLGRMIADGRFSRETLVWTAGQDGWKQAGGIADLARLFTVAPPPPPPAS